MVLDVYRQFFIVRPYGKKQRRLVQNYINNFKIYKYVFDYKSKRMVSKLDRVFVAGNHHENEYRFRIKWLPEFVSHVRYAGYDHRSVDVVNHELHEIENIDLHLKPEYELREYQNESIDLAMSNIDKIPSVLLDHQTGKGKGIISMALFSKVGMRLVVVIPAKYIDKWVLELSDKTTLDMETDLLSIRGSKELIKLMNSSLEKEELPNVIIVSNRTLLNYIKTYENCAELSSFKYPILPQDMMKSLKAGVLVSDESHQEFHALYKITLYFNVRLLVGMTATLEDSNDGTFKYYEDLFPTESRLSTISHDRYINVIAVNYTVYYPSSLQSVTNMGYSHILYEQSIMKQNTVLRNYVKLITNLLDQGFVNNEQRTDGDKVVIFGATIEFCTILTDYISNKYKEFKVRRYVEDDPYSHVEEGDIIITTTLSGGTAFDIKNLLTVIQTVSIKSTATNKQNLGRLRKRENKDVKFYYIYSEQISKQEAYHIHRLNIFAPIVKGITIIDSPIDI